MSLKSKESFTSSLYECLLFLLFLVVLTRPYAIIWNSSSRIKTLSVP